VLADYNPRAKIAVENTLAGDGSELPIDLDFRSMDDFKPDVVAGKVPELRALMAARNLLRDLKSNLLDNATFRRELEKILKNPALSDRLRTDLQKIGEATPSAAQ
jgi:type VI secretion system protein ImpB